MHERLFTTPIELRDAWWENKTGPLTTFIGNQIVVWGQSLAFRVGDVINPANTCWAFGFANLEQSRDAQWMIHPILNLPEWGPFTSNFLELVVQPGFQPNWQPEQYQDPYHKYRSALTAGRATPCLPVSEPWAERAVRCPVFDSIRYSVLIAFRHHSVRTSRWSADRAATMGIRQLPRLVFRHRRMHSGCAR